MCRTRFIRIRVLCLLSGPADNPAPQPRPGVFAFGGWFGHVAGCRNRLGATTACYGTMVMKLTTAVSIAILSLLPMERPWVQRALYLNDRLAVAGSMRSGGNQ